jgi:hypothetical protein
MNFSPELTTTTAIALVLFASFMWNTWAISLKYLGDYPLDGFTLTLFTTSFLLVWGVGFLLDGPALIGNLREVFAVDPSRIVVTILCGMGYIVGMRLSLHVMKIIGLSLTQPIAASINIFIGTAAAAIIGGIPPGFSIPKVVIACLCLFSAVGLSVLTGSLRSGAQTKGLVTSKLIYSMKDVWTSVGIVVVSSLFIQAYTIAISYGLRSVTQESGLAVMPFMAMLVTGAFVGIALISGGLLTARRQWGLATRAPFSIYKWGILSGLFHYGGNIIHTYGTAFLSSAISWPLGISGGFWALFWGLAYGEFKGSPVRVYLMLALAIIFYLLGAVLISSMTF